MHYSLSPAFLQNKKWKYSLSGKMFGLESNICDDKRQVKTYMHCNVNLIKAHDKATVGFMRCSILILLAALPFSYCH